MRLNLMGVLLAGILLACSNVYRFEKSSLVAHGELLNGAREALYYSIRIDIRKDVDARTMSALVKLSPEAAPLKLSELCPELVAEYLSPFIPPPQWPNHWKQKAKEEDAYNGGGFHITFKNDHLLFVGICSHCAGGRKYPIIGTPDGQRFYELPLTEKQIIEAFGSPNRIYKVNEVSY